MNYIINDVNLELIAEALGRLGGNSDLVNYLYSLEPISNTAHMNGYEGGKQEARDAAHEEIDRLKALLLESLRAMKYHTDQTRPIEQTFDMMDAIKLELSK
jgi:hypothetical protein